MGRRNKKVLYYPVHEKVAGYGSRGMQDWDETIGLDTIYTCYQKSKDCLECLHDSSRIELDVGGLGKQTTKCKRRKELLYHNFFGA
jgi:hypothetical protein